MAAPIRTAVMGATGRIGSYLTYMIARGEVFGHNQSIILHLVETPALDTILNSFGAELTSLGAPLVKQVVATTDLATGFKGVEAAFLVGSMTRPAGMVRKELLCTNVHMYKHLGQALDRYANKDVKVLVVGNCSNTKALICAQNAPSIPPANITAMTRLDQNRATSVIANKLGVPVNDVNNVIVWGNDSDSKFTYIDSANVKIDGEEKSVKNVVDDGFLNSFLNSVQVLNDDIAALPAAKGASDHMRDWWYGTATGRIVSMSVLSDGSYNIPANVYFSFPVEIKDKNWNIVQGLKMDEIHQKKLKITAKESVDEKAEALAYCNQTVINPFVQF